MPLYDYECGTCSHKFEMHRSFSEGASAICPRCQGTARRVFTPVPIVFKGSGFYVTDYRKEKDSSCGNSKTTGSCAANQGNKGNGSGCQN